MENIKSFQNALHKINQSNFANHALKLFKYQATFNKAYKSYLELLNIKPANVKDLSQIPFLPIEFFKSNAILTNNWQPEIVFESSGTTSSVRSKHLINDLEFYLNHATEFFEGIFGSLRNKSIVALLPSYEKQENSSLINMVNHFIHLADPDISGFYKSDSSKMIDTIVNKQKEQDIYLIGVTYALLDLAETQKLDLSHITVIETGGMKGRREEITKEELYSILGDKLNIKSIYSEYGMTELLSQAYGKDGKFQQLRTLRVMIRDINDPFTLLKSGRTGGINIIDLANIHSCAFIETKDLGRINSDGRFEVLGRFDNSDLRGCNLMV